MEQFIGCDAHKNFSVFVAVNEKGHAGEGPPQKADFFSEVIDSGRTSVVRC